MSEKVTLWTSYFFRRSMARSRGNSSWARIVSTGSERQRVAGMSPDHAMALPLFPHHPHPLAPSPPSPPSPSPFHPGHPTRGHPLVWPPVANAGSGGRTLSTNETTLLVSG